MSNKGVTAKVTFIESPHSYFTEVVGEAVEKRRLETSPQATLYLVDLLEAHIQASNLTIKTTFAEFLLKAQQAEKPIRRDMLKKLGDTSLYITGFFGDSLRRKIVDIDYYADIGGVAYRSLAEEYGKDSKAEVFSDFSKRFLDYVDLLTYISQNSLIQSNQDLLRLYERYVVTGSDLAKEQLVEKGLIPNEYLKKTSNQ